MILFVCLFWLWNGTEQIWEGLGWCFQPPDSYAAPRLQRSGRSCRPPCTRGCVFGPMWRAQEAEGSSSPLGRLQTGSTLCPAAGLHFPGADNHQSWASHLTSHRPPQRAMREARPGAASLGFQQRMLPFAALQGGSRLKTKSRIKISKIFDFHTITQYDASNGMTPPVCIRLQHHLGVQVPVKAWPEVPTDQTESVDQSSFSSPQF